MISPSKLDKRCHNQARKALERLDLPSKLAKRCHNQAKKGLRKVEMTFKVYQMLSQPGLRKAWKGARLACQGPYSQKFMQSLFWMGCRIDKVKRSFSINIIC